MGSRRIKRAQDLVRDELSRLLLYKAKDPELKSAVVTAVSMTPDLKRAVVSYSVLNDAVPKEDMQKRLERASGFLRREIGRSLDVKFIPELVFEYDQVLEHARHMDEVFERLHSEAKEGGDDGV
jgi:ribosome-binding factor A